MTDLVDRFTYKEELQSDHKGIGVIIHYGQRKKYTLDWSTYDKKMYEQITKDRLIELQFLPEYQQGTTLEKDNLLTNILTNAFSQSIQKKTASLRGKTFPDKIIRMIKVKRKLQKHLKKSLPNIGKD